ncbi:MAG: hypothetical protein WCP03_02370 [Candidatus Saccharibacteria bacterium]
MIRLARQYFIYFTSQKKLETSIIYVADCYLLVLKDLMLTMGNLKGLASNSGH